MDMDHSVKKSQGDGRTSLAQDFPWVFITECKISRITIGKSPSGRRNLELETEEKGKQQERAEAGHEEGGRKLSRRPRVEKREQLGIPGGLCLDLG